LERELRRKEEEVRSLMEAVETERVSLKEVEGEKKKLIKYELLNESMSERNNDLTSRLQEFEKLNHNLREEIFVYKTKLAENDLSSDKMNQYLEIALQSCRGENDALKRSKQELEKSLDEFMALNRHSHDNNRSMADQMTKYK
jgi:preprotein translocase subunit SecD